MSKDVSQRKKENYSGAGYAAVTAILLLSTAAAVAVSFSAGRFQLSLGEVIRILYGNFPEEYDTAAAVLRSRAARIGAALLIGASLSASGAAYQGIFRNPVVSPDILGAATGAGFGAALAILLGGSALVVQLSSFFFGLLAVAAAYGISRGIAGVTGGSTVTLVLTGMVVSSLFSAFISVIKFVGDPYDALPSITFWLMGGLTYITGSDTLMLMMPFATGMIPLMLLRWKINLLSLDDEEAESLGVDTAKLRLIIIICATLLSSGAVAAGGMIGWVGLIIPHMARMLVGPDYKRVLPCSVLTGSVFLLLMDDLARSLFAQEIPLGVLTAIIGAPCFLYLLFKGRKSFL